MLFRLLSSSSSLLALSKLTPDSLVPTVRLGEACFGDPKVSSCRPFSVVGPDVVVSPRTQWTRSPGSATTDSGRVSCRCCCRRTTPAVIAAPRLALLRMELLFDLETDNGDDLIRSSLRAGPRGPLDVVATRSIGRLFTWTSYIWEETDKILPQKRLAMTLWRRAHPAYEPCRLGCQPRTCRGRQRS